MPRQFSLFEPKRVVHAMPLKRKFVDVAPCGREIRVPRNGMLGDGFTGNRDRMTCRECLLWADGLEPVLIEVVG